MVALPLYYLLAAVGCGHRAVDERVTRGAEGDGRIDAQQGAEIDDIIKSLRRHAQPRRANGNRGACLGSEGATPVRFKET